MGERHSCLLRRQLWSVALPDGPLPPPDRPAAAAKVCHGAMGGHCRLQQSLCAGLCLHQQQGWPGCPRACIPDVSRWTQRSVLGITGVLESCICPSRNGMMRDSPAFRYNKLLNIKERSEEHTSELQSQSNLVCRL